jgi:hypothetical protein
LIGAHALDVKAAASNGKERSSFLKKRTKKLLIMGLERQRV